MHACAYAYAYVDEDAYVHVHVYRNIQRPFTLLFLGFLVPVVLDYTYNEY